jgi:hypothetical protein
LLKKEKTKTKRDRRFINDEDEDEGERRGRETNDAITNREFSPANPKTHFPPFFPVGFILFTSRNQTPQLYRTSFLDFEATEMAFF